MKEEFPEFTREEQEKMCKEYEEQGLIWTEWTEEERERNYQITKKIFGEEIAKKYYNISPQEITFRLRNLSPEARRKLNNLFRN